MSKEYIESKIPKAIEVLDSRFGSEPIPSSYNGYIASFGASIVQSGLKATLALFENRQANTKADKSCLTRIILDILDENHNMPDEGSKECPGGSLLRYVLKHKDKEEKLKEQIVDVAIALKLAIRTYELEKGREDE